MFLCLDKSYVHEENYAITPLVVYNELGQYDLLQPALLEDGTHFYYPDENYVPNMEYIKWQM